MAYAKGQLKICDRMIENRNPAKKIPPVGSSVPTLKPEESRMSCQHFRAAGMGRVIWIRYAVYMDLEKNSGHLPFTKSAKKTVIANPTGIACWM